MPKISMHDYSLGGLWAHLFRRAIHLMTLLFVWIYYQYGPVVAHFFSVSLSALVWICLAIVLGLEILRLWFGWTVFGQRTYEKKQISAFAWAIIAMSLVLLFSPGKQFVIPIISAYAIGDPLLGELRRASLHKVTVILIGCIVISGIWFISSLWWSTPRWLCLLMGPITVAAEWPCIKWIDDNALMQLAPLLIVLIFNWLFPL